MMISGALKGAGTAGHGVGGRFRTRESASHARLRKLAGGLALSAGCVGFTAKQEPIQGPQKKRLYRSVFRAWLLQVESEIGDGFCALKGIENVPEAPDMALDAVIKRLMRGRPLTLVSRANSRPRNAPIARFDGPGCHQTRCEIGDGFQAVFRSCFCAPASARLRRPRLTPSAPPLIPRIHDADEAMNSFPTLPSQRRNAARLAPVRQLFLCFCERIQGPGNASIARFDGLGCYSFRSEMGNAFQGVGDGESRFAFGLGACF